MQIFASYERYRSATYSSDLEGTTAAITITIFLIILIIYILNTIAMWKIFKKAGKSGWPAIVPIYNTWVLFEVGGLEGALSLICLIFTPFSYYGWYKVCKAFNKSTGFFVALIFFPVVCIPILGFGKDKYVLNGSNDGQNNMNIVQNSTTTQTYNNGQVMQDGFQTNNGGSSYGDQPMNDESNFGGQPMNNGNA